MDYRVSKCESHHVYLTIVYGVVVCFQGLINEEITRFQEGGIAALDVHWKGLPR